MVNGSFFWNQLIKLYEFFQWCTQWSVGNGARISYWYDCWGTTPLKKMKDGLPRPISQHISLQDTFSEGSPVLSSFTGTVLMLNESDDVLLWRWFVNGEYSACSIYKVLIESGRINWGFVGTWRAAAPLKVQVFSQLLLKDKLPTHEMLQRMGMNVQPHCVMCEDCSVETAKHLFFTCQNAKEVWARFVTFLQIGDTVRDTWEASCNFYCNSNRERNRHVWVTYFISVLWAYGDNAMK